MRVRFGGGARGGWALTVAVEAREAVAAVRDPDDDRVRCPEPGAVHDHVGLVAPRSAKPRPLLAAVARSLGHDPPNADRIAAVRADLDACDPPSVDVTAARERVASVGEEAERLRERVATLQGRVRTLRERDLDASDAEREHREAARRLSEAETERRAAEQSLDRARRRAREARDEREKRFALEERLANLQREARAALARRIRPVVDAAVTAVPGSTATDVDGAGPVTLQLAAARVAAVEAPVVLACRRFPDAEAAAVWLSAPVLRVRPEAPPPRAGRGTSSVA